jgi:dihydroorotate dehydrogenase, subfamily 2
MGYAVRKFTTLSYRSVIKPILFRTSPDTAHLKIVQMGQKISKSKVLLGILKLSWSYKNPKLVQVVQGIKYENPVGLAAGFDKNVQLGEVLENIGFGFFTGGSVTGRYCEGNPRPWFHRLPEHKALVVHAGLANIGSVAISRALRGSSYEKKRDTPLSISVARTNSMQASTLEEGINDYVLTLKNLQQYPDMFEINISCPNTYGGEPYTTPQSLEKLLTAIDKLALKQPVFIKMPSDLEWVDFSNLLEVIVRHNVAGVTISNLRKDRQGLTVPKGVMGGISGKPTQEKSDTLIYKTYLNYGKKLTIIGVGGIFTAEDAYRKIKNGASLVAMVTGLIYEGPQIIGSINSGLVKLLESDGYTNISEAIGTAVKIPVQ